MMLTVRVEYWDGQLPLEVVDGLNGPTDGVTRVYVRRADETMVLSGRDNYWVHGEKFGCFNDEENYHRWGRQESSWRWPEGENPQRIEEPMPAGAKIWRGVMLPDDQAEEVGLL